MVDEVHILTLGMHLANELKNHCSEFCDRIDDFSKEVRENTTRDLVNEGRKSKFYLNLVKFY